MGCRCQACGRPPGGGQVGKSRQVPAPPTYTRTGDARKLPAPPANTDCRKAKDSWSINAHASATPLNDSAETLALKQALGASAATVPVSGTKGYHGHALGATGAWEAAITLLALHDGWLPPCVNLLDPDPACDLPLIREPGGRDAQIDYALSNSFGFGGINACLVFGRAER